MVNLTKRYAIVSVLVLGACGFGHWVSARNSPPTFSADLRSFPMTVAPWKGQNMEMTADVQQALNADSIISRQYVNSGLDESLGLLVVYRQYDRRDFAHRPEMCYPAAGWEILKKTYVTVPFGGKNIRARLVVAQKDYDREAIVYWFASGEKTEANFALQQLWMAFDRLKEQRYGWAFIRIDVPVQVDEDQAVEVARKFLRAANDPLKNVLTGSR